MRTSPLAALLLATCLPPEPPAWLIHEPTFLGIQTAVVQDGPYAEGLPVYPGHERAQPLPLDTLELRLLAAAPGGMPLRDPIWIHCGRDERCAATLTRVDLPACPEPLLFDSNTLCRLGAGHRLAVRLGDLGDRWPVTSVFVVTSAELDPEQCLAHLRSPPPPDLTACMFAQADVRFGPEAWMRMLLSEVDDEVPDELLDEPANTNPTLSLVVHRADGDLVSAVDGDIVTVHAGERIEVLVRPGVDAAQRYIRVTPDGLSPRVEELTIEAFVDRADVDYAPLDVGRLQFTAPEDPTPVTLFVRMLDDRGGVTLATLQLLAIRGPS